MTPPQLELLATAREAARQAHTCTVCGRYHRLRVVAGLCHDCRWLHQARAKATAWARQVLATDGAVILDTETTALDGEVIDIGLVDIKGQVLLETRLRPLSDIDPGAQAVHGLTAERLQNAPSFPEIYPTLRPLLTAAPLVVIYNADFDTARLAHTCDLYGQEHLTFTTTCAMRQYARWYGQWSDYYRQFKWQRLPSGDHTAWGDAQATLRLIQRMAEVTSL